MKYKVIYTKKAIKSLKKLDPSIRKSIKSWIEKNLVNTEDPRSHGKALSDNRSGQWRYRVGDYRLLAEIDDEKIVIIMVNVGHRRDIYE